MFSPEGLQLREWTEADIPALSALFDEPEMARWTPLASPFDEAAARAYLTRAHERRAAVARATGFQLTDEPPVVRESDGRVARLRTWELRRGD
ncbi:GNAT family N-acetyltransferase [Streptomyces niveus]